MKNVEQKVTFLDVGHGDSSVIYLRDVCSGCEKVIVIDIVDSEKLLMELKKQKIKEIDLIILSHSDADHCRGVNDFLEKFMAIGSVKSICYNLDKRMPTQTMKLFLKKFLELRRKHQIDLWLGQISSASTQKKKMLSVGKSSLWLIYPNMAEATEAYYENNTNNASVVCLLKNDACNILFSGDLEQDGWERLLKRMPDLQCDILKMPHHGAFYDGKNSIGLKEILETLKSQTAIVSSGNHKRYRHPDEQTIKLLREQQIKIYCTEYTELCHCNLGEFDTKCHGDIVIEVNSGTYQIKTEVNNISLLAHSACVISNS